MASFLESFSLLADAMVKSLSYDMDYFSNTDLSDLRFVCTCDILFTGFITKSCDPPDWLVQTCYQSASSRVSQGRSGLPCDFDADLW